MEEKETLNATSDGLLSGAGAELFSTSDSGEKRRRFLRSPVVIYMLAIAAFMFFWYLYSFINAMIENPSITTVLAFLSGFMALFTCEFILFASVTGSWGKIARFAASHGMIKRSQTGQAKQTGEMADKAYEKTTQFSSYMTVYENCVAVCESGVNKVFPRSLVKYVSAYKYLNARFIILRLKDGGTVFEDGLDVSENQLATLKDLFGDKFRREDLRDLKRERSRYRSVTLFETAPLIIGLLCAGAGGGIVALHFTVFKEIPIVLGAFFVAGGLLLVSFAFDGVPVMRVFITPLIAGGIFSIVPLGFTFIISEGWGTSLPFESVHVFLSSFNPLFGAVFFLTALGVLFVITAFFNLHKYLVTGAVK